MFSSVNPYLALIIAKHSISSYRIYKKYMIKIVHNIIKTIILTVGHRGSAVTPGNLHQVFVLYLITQTVCWHVLLVQHIRSRAIRKMHNANKVLSKQVVRMRALFGLCTHNSSWTAGVWNISKIQSQQLPDQIVTFDGCL